MTATMKNPWRAWSIYSYLLRTRILSFDNHLPPPLPCLLSRMKEKAFLLPIPSSLIPLPLGSFELGVGEDSWKSLGLQGYQPVHPKADQSWVFIGRTDVEAETPILWPRNVKNWLIWKDPDAGKDRSWEEKGMTEDEMVRWHHRLDGHGFGWTPGVGDGQGGLVWCGSWSHKESDTTEQLNWTELVREWIHIYV